MSKNVIIGWIVIAISIGIFLLIYMEGNRTKIKNPFSIKDAEGNEYNRVKIGGQVWMKENLRTTKSRYGEIVKSFLPNNEIANVKKYGRLYTWEAAKRICPEGWRLPSDNDWKILINYLGSLAGAKMKDTANWISNSKNTNNETHFSSLPAGYGNSEYSENYFGKRAIYWSSTPKKDTSLVWCYVLTNYSDSLKRLPEHVTYAFSVRCIKN